MLCLWNSFNHLLEPPDQVQTLDEIHRVLRAGGRALLVVTDGESAAYRGRLAARGEGADGRVLREEIEGHPLVTYVFNRATLAGRCARSRFGRFRVGFGRMNRRRRIVARLWR